MEKKVTYLLSLPQQYTWSQIIPTCVPESHFRFFFFWCILFLKSLLNLLQYHFCFMLWILGHKACGILSPLPRIKPASLALEHKVSTTQLPGKFPRFFLYAYNKIFVILRLFHLIIWHSIIFHIFLKHFVFPILISSLI